LGLFAPDERAETRGAEWGRIENFIKAPKCEEKEIMAGKKAVGNCDIEVNYPRRQFVAKPRRLADCLEGEKPFRIQIGGERITIPPTAVINLEHERGAAEEEVEFQLKWVARSLAVRHR
jgi:hypothetical protein